MTEQQLAELFSERVDRLLQGHSADLPPEAADLAELLALVQPAAKTQFKVNPGAQAAFEQQIATWFGGVYGGSTMTILGLSKMWFISLMIVVVLISGAGFIGLVTTGLFVFSTVALAPASPTAGPVVTGTVALTPPITPTGRATPSVTGTVSLTPSPTGPIGTPPTVSASVTPGTPIVLPPGAPGLIFQQVIVNVSNLCRGAYVTQTVLVNRGPAAVTGVTLVWQVVQGAEFVKRVNLSGPGLVVQDTSASLSPSALAQTLALDVQIEVNESWWAQPDGAEIKVKLSVADHLAPLPDEGSPPTGDANRGHGNDPDRCDEDNPGQNRCDPAEDSQSQILSIVKQGGQWVTLTGLAYQFGAQTLLVDGKTVLINGCTALPPALPPGSGVQIIGIWQPNGTFIAVKIILIDIDLIIMPPDAPPPPSGGGDDDDDDDDDGGDHHRDGDHDRGHGNDPDGYDEDNPGRGKKSKK
jgi:hypothetical protein